MAADDLCITIDPDADAISLHVRPIPLTGSHPLDEARSYQTLVEEDDE